MPALRRSRHVEWPTEVDKSARQQSRAVLAHIWRQLVLSTRGRRYWHRGRRAPAARRDTVPASARGECDRELAGMVKKNEAEIRRLQVIHGAMVFRGFPMRSAEDFNLFVQGFNRRFITEFMGGGGPRKLILGPIYTSTETPAHLSIPFHHELSYLPPSFTPAQLCFFCVIPSMTEGETPVLPSWLLYEQLKASNPAFVERLQKRRVRYIRKIADRTRCANTLQRCWQDIFSAETREDAEKNAVRCGHDKCEWLEDGSARVTSVPQDPIRTDQRTERLVWWNSVALLHPAAHPELKRSEAPWTVTYADDMSEIADEDILSIVRIMATLDTRIRWQVGDALLVDNVAAMHARAPFTGERKIWTTMMADV